MLQRTDPLRLLGASLNGFSERLGPKVPEASARRFKSEYLQRVKVMARDRNHGDNMLSISYQLVSGPCITPEKKWFQSQIETTSGR